MEKGAVPHRSQGRTGDCTRVGVGGALAGTGLARQLGKVWGRSDMSGVGIGWGL